MLYDNNVIGVRVFEPIDEKSTWFLQFLGFFYFWKKKHHYVRLNKEMFL